MPEHGIESATVPGAVDGWQKLLDRFGKKKLNEVLAPAIQIADNGFPVTEWIALHFANNVDMLRNNEAAARTFLISDRPPKMGEVFRNPDLAWSLRQIAQGGRDAFYRGEITKRLLALSAQHGGAFTAKDFSDYSSEWVEPISTTYRGWTVYELPPNVQGIGALEMLNIMEQFNLNQFGLNSTRALHVQIEAKKLAYADVLRYIGDPKTSKMPVSGMLSKQYAAERAKLIDMDHANCDVSPGTLVPDAGDTTYLSVVDREGNMVSLIESNYSEFGSGLVADGTGFVLHNRGALFNLDPASPERVSQGASARCTRLFQHSCRRIRFASRSASWADGTRRRRTRSSCRTSWTSIRTFRPRSKQRASRSSLFRMRCRARKSGSRQRARGTRSQGPQAHDAQRLLGQVRRWPGRDARLRRRSELRSLRPAEKTAQQFPN